MKLKIVVLIMAALSGFFFVQNHHFLPIAHAVSRLYDRSSGDIIDADKDDAEWDNTNNAINTHEADTSAHGATGGVVGASKVQTLSNKTFIGNLPIHSSGDINVYSDAGSTLKASIDGATGGIGVVSGAKICPDSPTCAGDTYFTEAAANDIQAVAGGSEAMRVSTSRVGVAGDVVVTATKRVYLDGSGMAGGNTSFRESAADVITAEAGGVDSAFITSQKFSAPITRPGTYNISLARATTSATGDSIKVECGGAACSSSNFGWAVLPSITAGALTSFKITSDVTINLTGAHWGADTTGDLTGRILRTLFVNDNGTLRTCVALLGGRQTLLTTDTNATASNIDLPEEVLCNTAVGSATNTVYNFGAFRSDFDDTGGSSENLNTVQSGVNDIFLGENAGDDIRFPWNMTATVGWSGSPTISAPIMYQNGRTICLENVSIDGTSNSTSTGFNAPTKSGDPNGLSVHWNGGIFSIIDNGVASATPGYSLPVTGSTAMNVYKDFASTSWTNSGSKSFVATAPICYDVGPAASFID